MGKEIRKYSHGKIVQFGGTHRFEHWYIDNQVYFITARCRDRFPAFTSDRAKAIFWDRFEHYTKEAGFVPWVSSLVVNHYHTLGYCRDGQAIGQMMQRIHGSVAKLVNDTLLERQTPFWSEPGHQDYFDGCIRNETQCRRAFRYTMTQSVRHGIGADWKEYPDTREWNWTRGLRGRWN